MGVNTILTHSGRGDQSVEVRSVNPVVMRASTILFKDYDTWQEVPQASRNGPGSFLWRPRHDDQLRVGKAHL